MTFVPDDELMTELKATFAAEADEYIAFLNRDLLAVERSGSDDERQRLLKDIFRNAHSLKGGAAVVGLQDVRTLAHHLESIFAGLQKGHIALASDMFDALYRALDVIERLLQQEGANPALSEEAASIGAQLVKLSAKIPDVVSQEPPDDPHAGPEPVAERETQPQPRSEPEPASIQNPAERHQPRSKGGGGTIRIATAKLDDLMNEVGEVVVAAGGLQRTTAEVAAVEQELAELVVKERHRDMSPRDLAEGVASALDRIEGLRAWIKADGRRMDQVTDRLQQSVRRARMLPVSTVFDTFPRMVRDLAQSQGKRVRLEIRGGDTNLDRTVLEQIKSPLTHLIRNCIDHGLEQPAVREEAGKDPEGSILLSASQRGDTVVIDVTDDGAGIDVDRVRQVAVEKGGIRGEDARAMDPKETASLIFRSGLSTSEIITSLSGRGVGLDVVRENVETLNGTVAVDTRPGEGTTFSLTLPLTVATTSCVLVCCGKQVFAVPLTHVLRTARVSQDEIGDVEGHPAVPLAEGPLPLRDLAEVLGLGSGGWESGLRPVLVARCAEGTAALLVDEVMGAEDVIVKALPPPLFRVRHVAGGCILGTGEAVIVLNVADVVRSAVRSEGAGGAARRRSTKQEETRRQKILLADDSITTRTLEKNILESAGYDVRVAVDGAAAWRAIQEDPPDVVVSDVEMPEMDGFELTEAIRGDERFRYLPVVLVTSLESDADRERGIDVGADAYIGKSSFDQEHLIDVVQRLV